MLDTSLTAYEAWCQADAHAREVEVQLAEEWVAFDEMRGAAPTDALILETSRRRVHANEKLTEALAELQAARSAKRRII